MNPPAHHHHNNHHSNSKYLCRICNKGFLCGRALGGHMRAHGVTDDNPQPDEEDDDPLSDDWDDKSSDHHTTAVKRMYQLRTNPHRLKTCRSCENCGQQFLSWKSFLEHGKCTSAEDHHYSPPSSDDPSRGEAAAAAAAAASNNWSKRKRSFRTKVDTFNSCEEEDLANCLILLSNSNLLHQPPPFSEDDDSSWPLSSPPPPPHEEEEEEEDDDEEEEEEEDPPPIAPPPLFSASPISFRLPSLETAKAALLPPKGLFECKACKKVFNSHQALGGHRASHKKVKGCFASRLDNLDEAVGVGHVDGRGLNEEFIVAQPRSTAVFLQSEQSVGVGGKGKSKVHECSICHRVFSSGQALGGHKRCHWITSNSPEASSVTKACHFNQERGRRMEERPVLVVGPSPERLDLNLPACGDELSSLRRDPANPLSFEVSTEIYLQSWMEVERKDKHFSGRWCRDVETGNFIAIHNGNASDFGEEEEGVEVDEEEEEEEDKCNKVKLAKLSDLKDINVNGASSSPWLQVGIGSASSTASPHVRHES